MDCQRVQRPSLGSSLALPRPWSSWPSFWPSLGSSLRSSLAFPLNLLSCASPPGLPSGSSLGSLTIHQTTFSYSLAFALILSLAHASFECLLHDSYERSLATFRQIFGEVFNDAIFGSNSLKIHVGLSGEQKQRYIIVNEMAIASKPQPEELAAPWVFSNFCCSCRNKLSRK